ncbi:hypothetical protein K491DRAFT_417694 [Lophiostoma macrostomum CBS 122681]|uniref:Uncharacterized protein n=1 Tax=Lophiostoma macrostomum CBS 122681 TaxID=1314788 RepID=A0A6A6TN88_9PLEO|nr:hypothetical protein K491DRAFT_417694 [Lophiostoma macrostomum CBS 122681]
MQRERATSSGGGGGVGGEEVHVENTRATTSTSPTPKTPPRRLSHSLLGDRRATGYGCRSVSFPCYHLHRRSLVCCPSLVTAVKPFALQQITSPERCLRRHTARLSCISAVVRGGFKPRFADLNSRRDRTGRSGYHHPRPSISGRPPSKRAVCTWYTVKMR